MRLTEGGWDIISTLLILFAPFSLSIDTRDKDCSEVLASGVSTSGVYTVQPLDSGEAFQIYCDMETDGGGWTVR